MLSLEQRVAQRYLINQACVKVSSEIQSVRVASHQMRVRTELGDPNVLAAFFDSNIKLAFGGIVQKAKQLWKAFSTMPDKWEDFKKQIGVSATSTIGILKELPKKLKSFWKDANKFVKKTFAKAGKDLLKKFPHLEVYFKIIQKLPSVTGFFKDLINKFPRIKKVLDSIGRKATTLANTVEGFFDRNPILKPINWFGRAAFFTWVWMNVAELSWNVPEIIRGMLGGMDWAEILASLPESGLGLVVGLFFSAWIPFPWGGKLAASLSLNALLPMALAVQLFWFIQKGYAVIKNMAIRFTEKIRELGVNPEGLVLVL